MKDPSKWVETARGWDADKHYEERKVNGFSKADWINFDTYIAWVIASAVQKMKDEGHTMFCFPDEPESEWERLTNEAYDTMIKGFGNWAQDKLDYTADEGKQMVADLNEALDIFKRHFQSLWD